VRAELWKDRAGSRAESLFPLGEFIGRKSRGFSRKAALGCRSQPKERNVPVAEMVQDL